ncbi:hypothetical protein PAMA_008344 [Pampus argenteus]
MMQTAGEGNLNASKSLTGESYYTHRSNAQNWNTKTKMKKKKKKGEKKKGEPHAHRCGASGASLADDYSELRHGGLGL